MKKSPQGIHASKQVEKWLATARDRQEQRQQIRIDRAERRRKEASASVPEAMENDEGVKA